MTDGVGEVHLVAGQLEVHRSTRVLGLTVELAALDIHADDQPTQRAEDRADSNCDDLLGHGLVWSVPCCCGRR